MKTLIIVNPSARGGELKQRWPKLEKDVREALGNSEVDVAYTTAEDHGPGLVRKALAEGFERILVVGGDGTISDVVEGFFAPGEAARPINPEAVLAVLPAGRGDDFFKTMVGQRSYSSDEAWKRGLDLLRSGKPRATDVGRVEWISPPKGLEAGRHFINVSGFGFPGLVVERTGRRKGKTALTYLLQSSTSLLEYKPIDVEVRLDGQVYYEGPIFSGFVLNGAYNAGGVCWDSRVDLGDGLFHVLVTEPASPLAMVGRLKAMKSGDWKGLDGVHRATAERVEVRLPGTRRIDHPLFEIDGDQPEAVKDPHTRGAVFSVIKGAIRVWR